MITLHQGDSLQIVPTLDETITAVITDPPYGCKNNCNYTRFTKASKNHKAGIPGDDKPFDPLPWLTYPKVILFGYQFFAQALPIGTILVWNKRREKALGTFLSDCELAWMKGGKGCYLFNHVWNGWDRQTERGEKSLHPSQKPVALFEWCIDKLKLKSGDTVLDPYMGTGACGLACANKGINYVGIELVDTYFEIAQTRLAKFM